MKYSVGEVLAFHNFMEKRSFLISDYVIKRDKEINRWCTNVCGTSSYEIDDGIVTMSTTLYGSRGYYEGWSYSVSLEEFLSDDPIDSISARMDEEDIKEANEEAERVDRQNKAQVEKDLVELARLQSLYKES